jgi:hypothetical protein
VGILFSAAGETVLDHDVLALDIADLAKTVSKSLHSRRIGQLRAVYENADSGDFFALLRFA